MRAASSALTLPAAAPASSIAEVGARGTSMRSMRLNRATISSAWENSLLDDRVSFFDIPPLSISLEIGRVRRPPERPPDPDPHPASSELQRVWPHQVKIQFKLLVSESLRFWSPPDTSCRVRAGSCRTLPERREGRR